MFDGLYGLGAAKKAAAPVVQPVVAASRYALPAWMPFAVAAVGAMAIIAILLTGRRR